MISKRNNEAIVKHLREIANILEKSYDVEQLQKVGKTEVVVNAVEEVSKRGRKSGAVSDDIRCNGLNQKGERCKNRATTGQVCAKHNK